ncbi:MAG: GTP cyclohydrolase I [Actinomycetota bacterium]|nr:GTP cyclohydrolase I [Actinomycetota bacterium]MDA3013721.1 GTP cyclohydrolase I [Actinomycetota bacterium]
MDNKDTSLELTQEYLAEFLYETVDLPKDELLNIAKKFLDQISKKLSNEPLEETIFTSLEDASHTQPIYVNGLKFVSLCKHHLMPYFGSVNIAVLPKNKIAGISQFNKLVEVLSNSLSLQEELTKNICNKINDALAADGVYVQLKANHLCSEIKNNNNAVSEIITTFANGVYELDFNLRTEATLNFS